MRLWHRVLDECPQDAEATKMLEQIGAVSEAI